MLLKQLTHLCAFMNDRIKMQICFQISTYNMETCISRISNSAQFSMIMSDDKVCIWRHLNWQLHDHAFRNFMQSRPSQNPLFQ